MSYVFEPPARPAVPVQGGDALFPVRRIFCVARNYAAHAREMGQDPEREPPFFFCKPADSVLPVAFGAVGAMPYPGLTENLHHEFELVVALGRGGRDLTPEAAAACVWGYACGFDMTRRDLQGRAKEKGQPWDSGKSIDQGTPVSHVVHRGQAPLLARGEIVLEVNGEVRQRGDLSDMIWPIPEMLAQLSRIWALRAGDLVFTGTPEGVGPVRRGDRLSGRIAGVGAIDLVVS
ncbi:fumarylacetoacetate hydrolase family protein [Niveibacterium sp. SC-1]|uniref:fumarylacetoacetate hydrolase family protein n=1 Tax=Niveibacterium sp. SC-1 TaxID=3135646 RepID=UPI00311F6FBD